MTTFLTILRSIKNSFSSTSNKPASPTIFPPVLTPESPLEKLQANIDRLKQVADQFLPDYNALMEQVKKLTHTTKSQPEDKTPLLDELGKIDQAYSGLSGRHHRYLTTIDKLKLQLTSLKKAKQDARTISGLEKQLTGVYKTLNPEKTFESLTKLHNNITDLYLPITGESYSGAQRVPLMPNVPG